MGQLFAISFDSASSPAISFSPSLTGDKQETTLYGWGVGWYPGDELAIAVLKDATSPFNNSLTKVLQDWKHFRSKSFICHLRGAAKRISQTGTQPFTRSYAGRDWALVHDGDLDYKEISKVYKTTHHYFEPMGKTDSELVFCYLLNCAQKKKIKRLAGFGWEELYQELKDVSRLGTANFIICDGTDMVLFHGERALHELYWCRRKPPYEDTVLEANSLRLDLGDPLDANRTAVIIATSPLSEQGWSKMSINHMMVIRNGTVIFDACAQAQTTSLNGNKSIALQIKEDSITKRVLKITHETIYRYAMPVENSHHMLRLKPIEDNMQKLLFYHCEIFPQPGEVEQVLYEDVFGNATMYFELDQPYQEFKVIAESEVEITFPPAIDITPVVRRSIIPLVWMPWQRQMMLPYLLPPELPESQLLELSDFAMSFVERNDYDLYETLSDMNKTLYQDLAYVPGSTTVKSTPFEVFTKRQGVCQDFANLMICLARLLNVPARYRVGYIDTRTDYTNTIQSDASHAWVELYLPYIGWCGYDPTNGCLVHKDHVRVACGRNFVDASPTTGTIYKGGGDEILSVNVRVRGE